MSISTNNSTNNVQPQEHLQPVEQQNNQKQSTGNLAGISVKQATPPDSSPVSASKISANIVAPATMAKASATATVNPANLTNGQKATFNPPGGDNGQPHTIFVNGIGTSAASAASQAQQLANETNKPVDLVYQYTDRTGTILGDIGKLANPFSS